MLAVNISGYNFDRASTETAYRSSLRGGRAETRGLRRRRGRESENRPDAFSSHGLILPAQPAGSKWDLQWPYFPIADREKLRIRFMDAYPRPKICKTGV